MPYLDQGEFYSEFGNYDVRISLPKSYIVAATGELQDVTDVVEEKIEPGIQKSESVEKQAEEKPQKGKANAKNKTSAKKKSPVKKTSKPVTSKNKTSKVKPSCLKRKALRPQRKNQ